MSTCTEIPHNQEHMHAAHLHVAQNQKISRSIENLGTLMHHLYQHLDAAHLKAKRFLVKKPRYTGVSPVSCIWKLYRPTFPHMKEIRHQSNFCPCSQARLSTQMEYQI